MDKPRKTSEKKLARKREKYQITKAEHPELLKERNTKKRDYYEHMKKERPEKYEEVKAKRRKEAKERRDRLRKKSPDVLKETSRKSNQRRRNTPELLLRDYKTGAKKRGLSFLISDVFAMMMFRDCCYYCHRTPNDTGMLTGIDRIDNDTGYEYANVVPCCKRCNMAKWKLSQSVFVETCKRIARFI